MPMLFCCPPGPISRESSTTRFIKGSNPRRMPCTCLPPFNFTAGQRKSLMNLACYVLALYLFIFILLSKDLLVLFCIMFIQGTSVSDPYCQLIKIQANPLWSPILISLWGWVTVNKCIQFLWTEKLITVSIFFVGKRPTSKTTFSLSLV